MNAPAWIRLPEKVPYYGTDAFKEMKADMFIVKEFAQAASCNQFAIVVAHEFSHVVLDAIGHPLRKDEKAVDLTAMLLGFSYCIAQAHTQLCRSATTNSSAGAWGILASAK
jgi:hypothetical protein